MTASSAFARLVAEDAVRQEPDIYPALLHEARERLAMRLSLEGLQQPTAEDEREAEVLLEALVEELLAVTLEQGRACAYSSEELVARLTNDIFGWGVIQPYLNDPTVEEIMINGPANVWIDDAERGMYRAGVQFAATEEVVRLVNRVAGAYGRNFNRSSPRVNAKMPDGSRLNAVMVPLTDNVPVAVTIRRHRLVARTLEDLVRLDTLTEAAAAFLREAVLGRLNILVCGGTASGKTNTLNALASVLPAEERVISVEDTPELQLGLPNWIALVTTEESDEGLRPVTLDDLVINALRMRPDRIITGEARGPEIRSVLMAANTGHDGQLLTLHANGVMEVSDRVVQMWHIADSSMAPGAIKRYLADAFDLIIYIERISVAGRRRRIVRQIAELLPSKRMEGATPALNVLFEDRGHGLQVRSKFPIELDERIRLRTGHKSNLSQFLEL